MIADLLILAVGIAIGYFAPWAVRCAIALVKPKAQAVERALREAAGEEKKP